MELSELERYAVASLFTLALHASQYDGGNATAEAWGCARRSLAGRAGPALQPSSLTQRPLSADRCISRPRRCRRRRAAAPAARLPPCAAPPCAPLLALTAVATPPAGSRRGWSVTRACWPMRPRPSWTRGGGSTWWRRAACWTASSASCGCGAGAPAAVPPGWADLRPACEVLVWCGGTGRPAGLRLPGAVGEAGARVVVMWSTVRAGAGSPAQPCLGRACRAAKARKSPAGPPRGQAPLGVADSTPGWRCRRPGALARHLRRHSGLQAAGRQGPRPMSAPAARLEPLGAPVQEQGEMPNGGRRPLGR